MTLFGLTEKDRTVVRKLIATHMRELGIVPTRVKTTGQELAIQTPDIWIAKPTSAGGIPALVPTTGTGSDDFDQPGEGPCDLYRIHLNDDVPEIRTIEKEIPVYNLRAVVLPQEWLLVVRLKMGNWVAFYPASPARIVHGILTADVSGGQFTMDNVNTVMGDSPVTAVGTGDDNELTVENPHGFNGDLGGRADAMFCAEESQWECFQMTCPVGS